jgi:hypothetical protein
MFGSSQTRVNPFNICRSRRDAGCTSLTSFLVLVLYAENIVEERLTLDWAGGLGSVLYKP